MLASRPHLRTSLTVVGLLLLAALPVGMHLGHRAALRSLGRSLSRSAGQPVTISGLWSTLRPSIIVSGIRVGGATPMLTVSRAELLLDLRRLTHPAIRELRLIRPVLHLSDEDLRRWATANPRPAAAASAAKGLGAARAAGLPALAVEDGELKLGLAARGRALRLTSRGIFLRAAPGDDARRIVLGRTLLTADGETVVDLGAAAADLDPRRRHRLTRLAVLGGMLRAPGAHAAGLGIHSATLVEDIAGYRVSLKGKPAGKGTGSLTASARLGPTLRPVGRDALLLNLRSVDLTRLGSFLEPLGLRVGGSRVSGRVAVVEQRGAYRASALLQAENVSVIHPLLSRRAVGPIAAKLEGELRLDPSRGRVKIHALKVTSGAIQLELTGHVDTGGGQTRLALDLSMGPTPCQKVLASLPAGLAPKLSGMGLEGSMGLSAQLRLDTAQIDAAEVDVELTPLTCKVVADPPDADPRALLGEVTITVSGARSTGEQWPLGPSNPDYRPLHKISRHVRSAFIVAEDARFFRHRGFDGPQLRRALLSNLKEGRLLRGASTISQQLVKNAFLDHERSLSRKLQEAVLTWRLEQVLPKPRILELYLNMVEMGPGLYGVTQASRHYFGKLPSAVSPLEAAHLAALTPSPRHLAQRLRDGDPGLAWVERISMLLRMMRRSGTITKEMQERARAEQLSLLRH